MPRFAKDTVLLGGLGELHAGTEVPDSYPDTLGVQQPTDFARLDELGYLHPNGWTPGQEDDSDSDAGDDLDGLKLAELQAVAAEEDVDVTGLKSKAEVADAIRAHRAATE